MKKSSQSYSAKKAANLQRFLQCVTDVMLSCGSSLCPLGWRSDSLELCQSPWQFGILEFQNQNQRLANFSGSTTALWAYSLTTVSDHYRAPVIKTDLCIFCVCEYVRCTYACSFVVLTQLHAPYGCTWRYLTLLHIILLRIKRGNSLSILLPVFFFLYYC